MHVNFVLLEREKAELARLRSLKPERDWRIFNHGVHAWVAQTYLMIGQEIDASISGRFVTDAINVVHNSQLRALPSRPRGLVLGVRADYPRSNYSDWEIVQNQSQNSSIATWMPHWPQQGLVPRAKPLGHVKRVGYFGRGVNHYTRLLRFASGFDAVRAVVERCCAKAGLELVSKGPECWNDYSDVDIAIGIRAFGGRRFDTKPPTKLVNAWLAQVPFIGGTDSAFKQIGSPGENYICVSHERQLLSALMRLRDDPYYYAMMINAGTKEARQYAPERIAERWASVLRDLARAAFAGSSAMPMQGESLAPNL